LILGLCLTATARALEDWTDQVPGFSPSGRNRHHMCTIAPGRALLYGGRLGVGGALTDQTFLYRIQANRWILQSPAASPPARENGSLEYIGDDRAVLFGGSDGALRDDTWCYDLSESTWTPLFPAVSPTPRRGHRMAYLGGDRVLLFGGDDGAADDQTWIYDLGEDAWILQGPAISPPGRWDHDLARIDDGLVLLFGGRDSTGNLADTWIYDTAGSTWTEVEPPAGPAQRYAHAMACLGNHQAVLFGGRNSTILADTWIFDLNDSSWTEDIDSITPSPRHYHTLSETSLDGSSYLALFAGFFDIDDTWAFGGGDYIAFPPAAVEDLKASLAGGSLALSWSAVTADTQGNPIVVDHYLITRSAVPDVDPGSGDSLAVTPGPVFVDTTAAVGDTAVDHFYLVRAVHTSGRRSAGSGRAGEFDRMAGNGR
jgi:hypothetical protein